MPDAPVPDAYVEFSSNLGAVTLASGLGCVTNAPEPGGPNDVLCYARIDGIEYGTATLEHLTQVAAEDDAALQTFSLAVYPNPFVDTAVLNLTLPQSADVRIEAFDVLGRRVAQRAAALAGGTQTLRLDTQTWAPGPYLVRVQIEDGQTRTIRVIKR